MKVELQEVLDVVVNRAKVLRRDVDTVRRAQLEGAAVLFDPNMYELVADVIERLGREIIEYYTAKAEASETAEEKVQ